jgi:hypothetical protein
VWTPDKSGTGLRAALSDKFLGMRWFEQRDRQATSHPSLLTTIVSPSFCLIVSGFGMYLTVMT